MSSLAKQIGYFFIINVGLLTLLFAYIVVIDMKQLKIDNALQSIDPITNCPKISSIMEYNLICNYRPHLNLDSSITEFIDINEYTLSGVIHINNDTIYRIGNIKYLQIYIKTCNDIPDCIGFSFHPSAGIFFHNQQSIPIQHVRNWQFYIKGNSIRNIKEKKDFLQINRSNRAKPLKLELIKMNMGLLSIPRSYLSFGWNSGGANNQIMTLANMLKYCVIYHRTLIIPFQINQDEFIGLNLENSMLDLIKLSEICDYIFEQEISDENISLLRFRYLSLERNDFRNEDLLNQCDIDSRKSYGISSNKLNKCNLIHIKNGKFGILHNHFDDINGLYNYIIPNEYIRNAVDKKIKYHFNRFTKPYRIGIFRRTLKRPNGELINDITNQPYYCRSWKVGLSHSNDKWAKSIRKTIENNQYLMKYNNQEIKHKLASIYDLYDRTCAPNWNDIQQILLFHRQDKIDTEQQEPWFLVSDWIEWQSVELKWIQSYAAITIYGLQRPDNNKLPQSKFSIAWSKNKHVGKSIKDSKQIIATNYLKFLSISTTNKQNKNDIKWINDSWSDNNKEMYWDKEKMWFNMWMLSKSDFFVSSWFSTVTQTICHWRGKKLMFKSTNCYLNKKWNQTNNNKLWFDIKAIDFKPKLAWNNIQTVDV